MPTYNFQFQSRSNRPQSIDSNEDSEMNFDDQRDNMDQDIPAGKSPTAQSGPTAQFLNGMQYYARLDEHDSRRHQPGSGEPPQSFGRTYSTWNITAGGHSAAIEVNEWHHIHNRHYQIITWISYVYTIISYTYTVYTYVFDIDDIIHDIVYDVLPDVWHLKLSRAEVQLARLAGLAVLFGVGRVLLIPCYLNGNSVNTIPRSFRGKIPKEATADSRPDSGTGSRLFEINMWLWRYGRNFF